MASAGLWTAKLVMEVSNENYGRLELFRPLRLHFLLHSFSRPLYSCSSSTAGCLRTSAKFCILTGVQDRTVVHKLWVSVDRFFFGPLAHRKTDTDTY